MQHIPHPCRPLDSPPSSRRHPAIVPALLLGLLAVCALIGGCSTQRSVFAPGRSAAPHSSRDNAELDSPFPEIVARIPLAFDGATIVDVQLDAAHNWLYVTDSGAQLHIVDAESFVEISTLPVGGRLTIDDANARLYVASPGGSAGDAEDASVAVIDMATWEILDRLPGSHVAVDTARNRIYVGEAVRSDTPADAPGIRLYDGRTLDRIVTGTQPGIPVFNPLRNELLIVAYTVYTADAQTLDVRVDLLPAITAQSLPWCNGCRMAQDAYLFPAEELLVLDLIVLSTGAGAGRKPAPLFLHAATLQPPEQSPERLALQHTCGSRQLLRPRLDGYAYQTETFRRYVVYNNLVIYDNEGAVSNWRDGLHVEFVNAQTRQLYSAADYESLYVIDADTLQPLGRLPGLCIFDYDASTGRIYGAADGAVYIVAERGGEVAAAPGPHPSALPAAAVSQILFSPTFPVDNTLFVVFDRRRVLRSRDGGRTWVELRGGLPDPDPALGPLRLDVAISPNLDADQTLFAGGARGDALGMGMWRSADGGDSWQPVWHDLQHLRVSDVVLSPAFATDDTLLIYTEYDFLAEGEHGAAVFTSIDRGQQWLLVDRADRRAELPAPADLLPTWNARELPLRVAEYGRQLERTDDGGQSWRAVDGVLHPDSFHTTLLPAPDYPTNATIYVLDEFSLLRTRDGGETWDRLVDARLRNRDHSNKLTAGATTPVLASGGHRLLLGAQNGDLLWIHPGTARWQAVDGATPTPTPTPPYTPTPDSTATPTSTPLAPSAQPPADRHRPLGAFAAAWQSDVELRQALGWAERAFPAAVTIAMQPFERGGMIWRGDTGQIYVLTESGTWRAFPDAWTEEMPARDPTHSPPDGLLQPERGFGHLWRTHPAVRAALGWATAPEQSHSALLQSFQLGLMLRANDRTYTLIEAGDGVNMWY